MEVMDCPRSRVAVLARVALASAQGPSSFGPASATTLSLSPPRAFTRARRRLGPNGTARHSRRIAGECSQPSPGDRKGARSIQDPETTRSTVSDASPRLVAFDLDDTLAPSKSAIESRIGDLLLALAERVEVAIISAAAPAVPLAGRRTTCPKPPRRCSPLPPHADVRHAVLPSDERRRRDRLRPLADRRREAARPPRRPRGSGAAGPLGGRAVGRHPRGPRFADHLLGTRPVGPPRRKMRGTRR